MDRSMHISCSHKLFCSICLLFFALVCAGCGPKATAPYEPPADEVTGTAKNGEEILSEDSGP